MYVYIPAMATGTYDCARKKKVYVYHVLELQDCEEAITTRNIIFSDRLSLFC